MHTFTWAYPPKLENGICFLTPANNDKNMYTKNNLSLCYVSMMNIAYVTASTLTTEWSHNDSTFM